MLIKTLKNAKKRRQKNKKKAKMKRNARKKGEKHSFSFFKVLSEQTKKMNIFQTKNNKETPLTKIFSKKKKRRKRAAQRGTHTLTRRLKNIFNEKEMLQEIAQQSRLKK